MGDETWGQRIFLWIYIINIYLYIKEDIYSEVETVESIGWAKLIPKKIIRGSRRKHSRNIYYIEFVQFWFIYIKKRRRGGDQIVKEKNYLMMKSSESMRWEQAMLQTVDGARRLHRVVRHTISVDGLDDGQSLDSTGTVMMARQR